MVSKLLNNVTMSDYEVTIEFFSKLFTWIQVITWITHTEFGCIRTIQGPNSTIYRTIRGQIQPFLEQYKAILNHF